MKRLKSQTSLVVILFLLSFEVSAVRKIIRGDDVPGGHPGDFNTVALVKEDGKIFCTGSLVAPQLIATAKHCLMDKEGKTIKVYFGPDTNEPDESLYRPVVDYKVRHPLDWTMTFPSFDVAWVKFSGDLPLGFRPLPVLADGLELERGEEIIQVGFGDNNPSVGSVEAGKKLWGRTNFSQYIINPRFFHILLFEGEKGQGSCHGDSGGPAYIFREGQWYIAGVTNGFDVVLTPRTMRRTGDPDFPYTVDCAENQSLYSFLGAHGDWIEKTSGVSIFKSGPFKELDRENKVTPENLKEWCEARDIGSPQWNLLKILLDKKVDELDQEQAKDFYQNCDQVVAYLEGIDDIKLDHKEVMEGTLSFEPLSLLPNLKSVGLYNYPRDFLKLETIDGIELEKLTLKNNGIENLSFLKKNTIEHLSFEQNPLYSLRGIDIIEGLKSINVSGTPLKDLSPLAVYELQGLEAVGLNSSIVLGMDKISESLKELDLRNTLIPNQHKITRFKELKKLYLTGDLGRVDLSPLKNLERLSVKDFDEGSLIFPQDLSELKELIASQNDISDLDFLKTATNLEEANLTFNRIRDLNLFEKVSFPHLKSLNLSVNPILNARPLIGLSALQTLRLFRTPLQRNLIPRTEENCPTTVGPQVLRDFCQQ